MSRLLRVLIACEFSGVVRSAFERRGWEAWSCDFLPTEKPSLFHHQGDVRDIIGCQWDLLIAHPPCTFLVTSGNRWFYHPDDTNLPMIARRAHPDYPTRWEDQQEAVNFVRFLWNRRHIPHIAIENPVGILPQWIGQPQQKIHPYQFGHDVSKTTCLWLKNLPPLVPTRMIAPRVTEDGKNRWGNQVDASGADKTPPSPDRWKTRSRTHAGIGAAMAAQWGAHIENLVKNEGVKPPPLPPERQETWRDARECSADHYLDYMDSYDSSY